MPSVKEKFLFPLSAAQGDRGGVARSWRSRSQPPDREPGASPGPRLLRPCPTSPRERTACCTTDPPSHKRHGPATVLSTMCFLGGHKVTISTDQQDRYIAIWSRAVETQMHFNEMSVKSRQLGLTFVAAALGVGVVLLSRGDDFALTISLGVPIDVHISVLLIGGSALALYAVRKLDLGVYHKMLRGAVTFGEDFEENYMKQIFDLDKGMTQAISHFSRHEDASKIRCETGKYQYTGASSVSAEHKIRAFYKTIFIYLAVAAFAIFALQNLDNFTRFQFGPKRGISQMEQRPGPAQEATSTDPQDGDASIRDEQEAIPRERTD